MAALCSPQRKDTLESDGDGGAGITFSKFKYRFQNLLTEVRALKSKECSARMEAEVSVQKLRSKEADQDKEKASLQAQITEATEARQKLENAIKIMELEMSAMEKNVASSKMQLKAVLDSRNTVMEELKIANYELEQKLKNTSSHLSVAMEKLSRNTMLFEAVEQEASSVKRTLDETRQIVASRADMVAELQQQVAWLVDIEQKLLDKARLLECELRNKNVSCSKKEKEIIALRHMLDTRNDSSIQEKLTIIQKSSEAKDRTISVLTMDKQGLIGEIESLKAVVKRFQEAAAEQDSSSKILREKVLDYQHLLREKSKMCEGHLPSSQELRQGDLDLEENHEAAAEAQIQDKSPARVEEIKEPIVVGCSSDKEDATLTNDVGTREEHLQQCAEKEEGGLTSCTCGRPPDSSMLECVSCNNQFHAAYVSWEESSSAYTCTSCQNSPVKKMKLSGIESQPL